MGGRENKKDHPCLYHSTVAMLRSALLLLAGLTCGAVAMADDHGSDRVRIGFAQDTLANDWRLTQVRELTREVGRYPRLSLEVTDGEGRTSKQIADIEDLIRSGVDILIASPRDSRAMAPVIGSAYLRGIPVILLTRGIVGSDYTTLIAADDRQIGSRAADALAKAIGNRGRVLMLEGIPTATTAIERTEGFVRRLARFPNVQITARRVANYLRSDAVRVVEEVIREGIPFDAIYAHSDSMASGARLALSKAGKSASAVPIVGIDYITEAREAILNGEQIASFTYPTCASEAVSAINRLLAGKKLPKRIVVESTQVTRDNARDVAPIF